MKTGARSSGFYYIRESGDSPVRVFCDLASESGWAWTLVMSQSFRNRKIQQLMRIPLSSDAPLNSSNPNWEAYRLSLKKMKELRTESSHWRVTCNFPTDVFDYRDYVKGNFSQVNLLNVDGHNVCRMVDYINVKGRNCSHCTVAWWQDTGTMFHHDLSLGKCFFETFINVNTVFNADYFGWYENIDSSFSCCTDDSSSTNRWFGAQIWRYFQTGPVPIGSSPKIEPGRFFADTRPGARFSRAPEIFRDCKSIFSSSVYFSSWWM